MGKDRESLLEMTLRLDVRDQYNQFGCPAAVVWRPQLLIQRGALPPSLVWIIP